MGAHPHYAASVKMVYFLDGIQREPVSLPPRQRNSPDGPAKNILILFRCFFH